MTQIDHVVDAGAEKSSLAGQPDITKTPRNRAGEEKTGRYCTSKAGQVKEKSIVYE
ncbi:hypothetical protein LCC91_03365 [Tepidimonas taiwanensis]|uniref:hypothetical protein n=1 Tax=Tepidimonas taiwanensis TaxID=307486 RepID=UPI001CCAC355|nr:hypothetical protein [Tepidimonas taiwanensis]UBQ06154.1 hypothetical protein LCC91_03365 [Tepidimonas taiwanensis]